MDAEAYDPDKADEQLEWVYPKAGLDPTAVLVEAEKESFTCNTYLDGFMILKKIIL